MTGVVPPLYGGDQGTVVECLGFGAAAQSKGFPREPPWPGAAPQVLVSEHTLVAGIIIVYLDRC